LPFGLQRVAAALLYSPAFVKRITSFLHVSVSYVCNCMWVAVVYELISMTKFKVWLICIQKWIIPALYLNCRFSFYRLAIMSFTNKLEIFEKRLKFNVFFRRHEIKGYEQ
jgi:hypothetical protein